MNAEEEKALRAETVSCLVAISKAYSATTGHNALKHWDRFQSALRLSLSGVSTMGQWQERIRSALKIVSQSKDLCSAMETLDRCLETHGIRFSRWLHLVRGEAAWFIVQLRLESEARAEEFKEKKRKKETVVK
jgi:hypothetical protein